MSGEFIEVNIAIGKTSHKIQMEKGVTFENKGGIYTVDENGQLKKFDKAGNVWQDANQIQMTNYQWKAFQNVSNNDGDATTYTKADIEKAQQLYREGKFTADMSKDLPSGYKIEKPVLNSKDELVQVNVTNGNESQSATLKFQIQEIAELKAASQAKGAEQASGANEISIVDFTRLPVHLRQEHIREKYDLNKNGLLDSGITEGKNEIRALENAMNIDLSEYKVEASKVETDVYSRTDRAWTPYQYTVVYDEQGKEILRFESEGEDGFVEGEFTRAKIDNNVRTIKTYDENLEPQDGCKKVTFDVTYNNIKGFTKTEIINADGSSTTYYEKGDAGGEMPSPDFRQIRVEKNVSGEIVQYVDWGVGQNGDHTLLESWEK